MPLAPRRSRLASSAAAFAAISVLLATSSKAAACDALVLPLDAELQDPPTTAVRFWRDSALYMLRGLVSVEDGAAIDQDASFVLPCEQLPAERKAVIATAVDANGHLDRRKLRDVFQARYYEAMRDRAQDALIKPTLLEFKRDVPFTEWSKHVVERSVIKRKTRAIYRSPAGWTPAISVAQTIDSETGDLSAPVLETEIAVARADGSGDRDFYAYDRHGAFVPHSAFPGGERAVPIACVDCHYDGETRRISRLMP